MSEPTKISTGIEGLDHALDSLRTGDNVVWQINSLADYIYVANRFVMNIARAGKRIVYFRFGEHVEVVDADALAASGANAKKYELDAHIGFESFTVAVHRIIRQEGKGVFYIFDCLTELQKFWFSDRMISNFFCLTNPYLSEMESIGYFPIMYESHTYDTISHIRHAAPVLLNMRTMDGALYIHPVNVNGRSTKTMYFPICLRGDQCTTLTSSVDTYSIFEKFVQIGEQRDCWDKMFDAVMAGDKDDAQIDNILQCLLGIEPQRLELCRRYFSVKDLIDVKNREIGTGCIGGKAAGMLLARNILRDSDPEFFEKRIEPHDSYYIGADVFYTYFVDNNGWGLRTKMNEVRDYLEVAPQIQQELLHGTFSPGIKEQFLSMLEYFGQSPIIVRSSSLLEDGFGNAFAGKYDSVFCANQGTLEERYAVFEQAVRTVYASTVNIDAIQYRADRNLLDRDEQMALLVMRVSGDCHGKYYYPHIAGVGHSKNLYICRNNTSTENKGMLRLVLGMGTRAVDREADDYARLISLDNPRAPLLCEYGDEYRFSQHHVDAIDLEKNEFVTIPAESIDRRELKADMSLFTEADLATINRFRELGIRDKAPDILSFKKLLWQTDFAATMTHILSLLQEKYDYPVDIEYACNFREGPDADYRINLLQCRPLQTKGIGSASVAPEMSEYLYKIHGNFMGGNMCQPVRYIVQVKSKPYLDLVPQMKYQTARTIGTLNALLRGKQAVLIGPGRWGTTTISLGVPVNFMEISHFMSVAEVSYNEHGLVPELSYGSHFFQDLVEAGTFYSAIYQDEAGCDFRESLLSTLPDRFTELVPPSASAGLEDVIHVYDVSDRGAILYAEVESQECFLGWN